MLKSNIVIETSVGGGSRRREEGNPEFISSRNSSRTEASAGVRSTGPVDRRQKQQLGRPVRSTDVHADMHSVAVDRPGRPQEEIGRPGGRPTEVTQLSVGNGRPARSTGAWGRSTGRSTDSRAVIFRKGYFGSYKRAVLNFLGFCICSRVCESNCGGE